MNDGQRGMHADQKKNRTQAQREEITGGRGTRNQQKEEGRRRSPIDRSTDRSTAPGEMPHPTKGRRRPAVPPSTNENTKKERQGTCRTCGGMISPFFLAVRAAARRFRRILCTATLHAELRHCTTYIPIRRETGSKGSGLGAASAGGGRRCRRGRRCCCCCCRRRRRRRRLPRRRPPASPHPRKSSRRRQRRLRLRLRRVLLRAVLLRPCAASCIISPLLAKCGR